MYQALRHLLQRGVDPDRLWWLRLDHPLLTASSLGDLVRAVLESHGGREQEPLFLFLDEIVYAKDWDLWLKTFYDERWPVRIVATSSATAALRDRRLESGVGRWQEHYLMPYLFGEFLDLAEVKVNVEAKPTLAETLAGLPQRLPGQAEISRLRREFLFKGGFPELLLNSGAADDRTELLRSQQILRSDAVERAIYKDIPQSFGVDSPLTLERLLYALGGQMAGILSPTHIGAALGMVQPRLDRYLSYLEHAFLVFTLPNYSGSEINVQKRGRKLFFVDGAVRNAALQRGIAPLDHPEELGLLMENLVASNLHALSLHEGIRLFHWRDGKNEVDLILDHPTAPVAFEVGSSPDHSRAGLVALMQRHPRFSGACYLIAPNVSTVSPSRHVSGVGTLPLDLFLIAIARQAEYAERRRTI
jgi:predicted AAA+ superfamily ATPase